VEPLAQDPDLETAGLNRLLDLGSGYFNPSNILMSIIGFLHHSVECASKSHCPVSRLLGLGASATSQGYCALGIFGIHMPLVYGEGPRAFTRLQEEILRVSTDYSLFCWSWGASDRSRSQTDLLSLCPQGFFDAALYAPRPLGARPRPYAMTNAGLSIRLPLVSCWSSYIGVLQVEALGREKEEVIGISMSGSLATGQFARRNYPDVPIHMFPGLMETEAPLTEIFVPLRGEDVWQAEGWEMAPPSASQGAQCRAGVLLSFAHRDDFEAISTIPAGRFSAAESIVQICPQEARNGGDGGNPQREPDTLKGATIVNFTLNNQETETILFVISSSTVGSFVQPSWHVHHLLNMYDRVSIPEPLRTILADTLDNYSEALGIPPSQLEDSEDVKQARLWSEVRDVVDTNSTPMAVVHPMGGPSLISVHVASSGFLTTTGSMLKHVHISRSIGVISRLVSGSY